MQKRSAFVCILDYILERLKLSLRALEKERVLDVDDCATGPFCSSCAIPPRDSFIFYSAPPDFVMLGVFCARFPPREANIYILKLSRSQSSVNRY